MVRIVATGPNGNSGSVRINDPPAGTTTRDIIIVGAPTEGTIQGRVRADNLAPLASGQADVRLQVEIDGSPGRYRTVRTQSITDEGRYEFQGVLSGRDYRIVAGTTTGSSGSALAEDLPGGTTSRDVLIGANGESAIIGQVVNENAVPLPAGAVEVKLQIRDESRPDGFRTIQTQPHRSRSHFAFVGVESGRDYRVRADAVDGTAATAIINGLPPGTTTRDVVAVGYEKPAELTVTDLRAPRSAVADSLVTVDATVENDGGDATDQSVVFRLDKDRDGALTPDEAVTSTEMSIPEGETASVEFQVQLPATLPEGEYIYGVFAGDASATDSITVESPPGVTIRLTPRRGSVATNGQRTLDVEVEDVDGGIDAYDIAIGTSDASVARIVDASASGSPTVDATEVADDGTVADFRAAGADTADSGTVRIGRVTIIGADAGTADLSLSAEAVVNDDSDEYRIARTIGAQVTVATGDGPVVIGGRPATDPDGDGVFEDVDGSGAFNIADVAQYLRRFEDDPMQSNAAQFDIDGDGRVTIADVTALLRQL